MLSSLLLYLLFAAGGIFIGAKVLKPDREYKWIGRLQTAALMILIFTMGVNIGADERVLSSVGTLGVRALGDPGSSGGGMNGWITYSPVYHIAIQNDGQNGEIGPQASQLLVRRIDTRVMSILRTQGRDGGMLAGG